MKRFNIATYILIAILVFVIIPLGIAFLVSFNFINTDTSNEWIGFWGGYLGSIIGGVITLYVLFRTLIDGKRLQKREEKLVYCDRIVDAAAEYNSHLSIFLLKITKYYFYIEKSDRKMEMFEEVSGVIYAIEKSAFILNVQLCSKEEDKEYNNIAEIKSVIDDISNLLACITVPLKENKLQTIEKEDFNERCKKLQMKKNKLFAKTISFLAVNKKM